MHRATDLFVTLQKHLTNRASLTAEVQQKQAIQQRFKKTCLLVQCKYENRLQELRLIQGKLLLQPSFTFYNIHLNFKEKDISQKKKTKNRRKKYNHIYDSTSTVDKR